MNLSVENVSFHYKTNQVLKNVSLCGTSGEVIGILGPNGTGKTTLFKCIGRILDKYSGEIRIDGKSILDLSKNELAKTIAFVPQDTSVSFAIDVYHAILLGRTPYVRLGATERDLEIAQQAAMMMGLERLAFQNIAEISGGERQRVFIARAIAQEPKIMILDEPTSALDLKYQISTMKMVRKIAEEKNILVIIAMHDLNLASRFTDRILLMKNGVIVSDGTPGEVLNEKTIQDVYDVDIGVQYMWEIPHIYIK